MTTSNDTPDNESSTDLTIDDFRYPGMLFSIDDYEFITAGGIIDGQLNVIRVENAGREQIDTDLLREDIEAGDVSVLARHDSDTHVGVDRVTLATLIDYAANDIENYGDSIPDDVHDAVEVAKEQLE